MEETSDIERIRNAIIEHIPQARKLGIQNEDELIEAGLLDSLGILDVVSHLEEEFSISVSDDELIPENFNSIMNMSKFVKRKKCNVSTSEG